MMNAKFEQLLREYVAYMGGLGNMTMYNYNTLNFTRASKKQFVNLITKEVLFEVWIEGLPNKEHLYGEEPCNPILCWKEYWNEED